MATDTRGPRGTCCHAHSGNGYGSRRGRRQNGGGSGHGDCQKLKDLVQEQDDGVLLWKASTVRVFIIEQDTGCIVEKLPVGYLLAIYNHVSVGACV